MTRLAFPMPGDAIDTKTVIASVEFINDDRGEVALVLLLERDAPFYTVAHYAVTDLEDVYPYQAGEIDVIGQFRNIVPAVRAYEDNGGDY